MTSYASLTMVSVLCGLMMAGCKFFEKNSGSQAALKAVYDDTHVLVLEKLDEDTQTYGFKMCLVDDQGVELEKSCVDAFRAEDGSLIHFEFIRVQLNNMATAELVSLRELASLQERFESSTQTNQVMADGTLILVDIAPLNTQLKFTEDVVGLLPKQVQHMVMGVALSADGAMILYSSLNEIYNHDEVTDVIESLSKKEFDPLDSSSESVPDRLLAIYEYWPALMDSESPAQKITDHELSVIDLSRGLIRPLMEMGWLENKKLAQVCYPDPVHYRELMAKDPKDLSQMMVCTAA